MTLAISHSTPWMHPIQSHGAECVHFASVLPDWPATSLANSAPRQRDQKEQSADESKGGSIFVPKTPTQFSSRPVHSELLQMHKMTRLHMST